MHVMSIAVTLDCLPGLCGPLLHAGLGPRQGEEEPAEEGGQGGQGGQGGHGATLPLVTASLQGSSLTHYTITLNAGVDK